MSNPASPYLGSCGFCEQGMLRFLRCPKCQTICAVCDECELSWREIAGVHANPKAAASSAFPTCPACQQATEQWGRLDAQQVSEAGLAEFVAGTSE